MEQFDDATVRISTRLDVWGDGVDQVDANRAAQRLVDMIAEEFGCEPELTDGESFYEYDEIERFADSVWVSCL